MSDKKCITSFSSKVRRVHIKGSTSKSLRISSEREKRQLGNPVNMYVCTILQLYNGRLEYISGLKREG